MIKKFERIISTTQSKYKANLEKKDITQQCSYNLPNEMESYLKTKNAIVRVTPAGSNTNVIYDLDPCYQMSLGNNILAIIGNEYASKNNKVVFTHTEGVTGGSQKIQLKKTDFSSRGVDYQWFVDLYEKNIELVNFVAYVDDVQKELKFDVELSKELFSGVSVDESSSEENDIHEPTYSFNEDELGQILKDMVDKGPNIVQMHLFGIKYGRHIRTNKYSVKNIVDKAGLSVNFVAEVNKGIALVPYVKELETPMNLDDVVSDEDYSKFKKLIEWFVKQLNINNELENGTKTSGKGCDGNAIRDKYNNWRDYGSFILDCTLQGGYMSTSSKVNYIHKTMTGFNIRPCFDKSTKEVKNLTIDIYNSDETISEELQQILDKEYKIDELELFDGKEPNDLIKQLFDDFKAIIDAFGGDDFTPTNVNYCTGYSSDYSRNRILFGAPGTGKSFQLSLDSEDLVSLGGEYERVTFHPNYSYANFVGTYKPVSDCNGKIRYEFVPGPFIRTYIKALQNSRTNNIQPYLVLIEEINRAEVAAVFGDVFQLLDRNDKNISMYPVQASEDIKKYLAKEENLGGKPEDYQMLCLPDNMFIWASMNSADQGVFPMDTAFKRRWDFTYIGINDVESGIKDKYVVLGTGTNERKVEWNELRKAINDFMSNNLKINEDKLLGPYFIANKVLANGAPDANGDFVIDKDIFTNVFKNKVIMYLFEDAAKQKKNTLFSGISEANRYSDICKAFDDKGVLIFAKEISDKFPKKEDNK